MARLKIEEIVLTGVSLSFLIWLLLSGFFSNEPQVILKNGLINLIPTFDWWSAGLIMIFCFSALPLIKKNRPSCFFGHLREKGFRNSLPKPLSLLRPALFIGITALLGILTLGALQQEVKHSLVNSDLLEIDKLLTGQYPLFWLHSAANPLNGLFSFLTPLIINSFLSLGAVMGLLGLIFYFKKNKGIFREYVMAIFISFAIAMPIWYFFPSNSPANYLLHDSGHNFDASLSSAIQNYQPNSKIAAFQEKNWQNQKNSLPVSTAPSMHWIWSGIVIFYLFKKDKKIAVFSCIWLILILFSTIYLGNHYLADGLAAIPVLILSLMLAQLFAKIGKKHCREDA